jgi:hypothetical protein
MMKSGLSQNEKLSALRIVIDNVNENTLNSKLSEIAHIKRQIEFFEQSDLKTPCPCERERAKYRYRSNNVYSAPMDAMRFAVCYTGNPKPIRDAKLNYQRWNVMLKHWQEGDSVLCLTDDDINKHSGCFHFNDSDATRDEYWVYQGREQNGDYSFKYTADYHRCDLSKILAYEYFKQMCPAEAMKLERRHFYCRDCWDQYEGLGGEGIYELCGSCLRACEDCYEINCVCP